jgi:hypothetical protein
MTHLEIHSKVDSDGLLALNVPVGMSEANRMVKVTVDSLDKPENVSAAEWQRIIEQTAGKWQGEKFERAEQGNFEQRNAWA